MRNKIATFCDDCKWCPELFVDEEAPVSKTVILTDDFGGEIQMSKYSLSILCDKCLFCPEIFIDESADTAKQVSMNDDFGNTVYMSKKQFSIFVAQAKEGKLEV